MIRDIQEHLQNIYQIEAPDISDFLLDEEQLQALKQPLRPCREWVLIQQEEDELNIGVYLHAEDRAAVEKRSPLQALSEVPQSWALVTEGISHFLLLFRRALRDEPVSLLELEAQAEVDKYVCSRLLIGLHPGLRGWIHQESQILPEFSTEERERYHLASRMADRYCERLERHRYISSMLAELRSFYRQSGATRLELLRKAA